MAICYNYFEKKKKYKQLERVTLRTQLVYMGGRSYIQQMLTAFIFHFPGSSTYHRAMIVFLSKMLFITMLPKVCLIAGIRLVIMLQFWHLSVRDYGPTDCSSSDAIIDLHCVWFSSYENQCIKQYSGCWFYFFTLACESKPDYTRGKVPVHSFYFILSQFKQLVSFPLDLSGLSISINTFSKTQKSVCYDQKYNFSTSRQP